LSRHERQAVTVRVLRMHIWAAATLTPLLVRLLSLPLLVRLLTSPRGCRPYAAVPPEQIAGLVARRLARPRNMRRRACLRQSLVLFHFFRLAGLAAELHVGMYPPSADPARLHGHCWVTIAGRPLPFSPQRDAAETVRFDSARGQLSTGKVLPKS